MEDLALDLQLSRVISAFESTTLFTAITPRATALAEATSVGPPVVTVTSESTGDDDEPKVKFIGVFEIAIAFGILVLLTIVVAGIIFCQRHKKAKRNRAAALAKTASIEEKYQGAMGHSPPAAHLPSAARTRVGERSQGVHEYWHNEASHHAQGWEQAPQAGTRSPPPRYR
ncbi:hypothetical protein FALBO_14939 [Fusarium albosuccineum]|uniref:Transmembrane protein n=1 Tax=Fusarium albosuccineum TaxID=1237068 RepID=A0A8H4PF78_9HYPO|nr:hypothetical protein FALBO_14939 [Fusarium albosuccineum]